MQLADHHRDTDTMSPAIYAALVGSLFQNPAPMLAGAVCAAIAAVMTALKTGNHLLWPCAVLLVLIGMLRTFDMAKYKNRRSDLTAGEAARWEARYQIGAVLYAIVLGAWCAIALLMTDDAVAHMICISVTTGYVAAGAGRAYGRPWIFHLQILLTCGPMAGAMALKGSPYYLGMALLTLLYFLGLERITTRLQQIFLRALIAREREAALAGQFDTALNNMPHGLCMFGADGRLGVMNYRFSEMMHLADDFVHRSVGAADVIAACVAAGTMSSENGQDDYLGDREFAGRRNRDHRRGYGAGAGAVVDVPADGRRRHGRAGRGHHGAAQGGSENQPSRPLRSAYRIAQQAQLPRRNRTPAGDFQ